MRTENTEMYLGAIFRLRENMNTHLPLKRLQEYFDFSPISIHEMISKLEEEGLVEYRRYYGVRLTGAGEAVASNMVRRHRIWEVFLTRMLGVETTRAHEVADQLEHAAPAEVTERLADLLGKPEACPHGSLIPPFNLSEKR